MVGPSEEYYPWIEWYPNASISVKSPEIHPGDLVFIAVWNTSPTEGSAYFYNLSTLQAATYKLTAPKGTTLVGNSVEWILERPCLSRCKTSDSNHGYANLTNYIDASWPHGVAWNYTASAPDYYYMGNEAPTGQLWVVEMLDNAGNGISFGKPISGDFLYFQDYGSACGQSDASPC